MRILFRLHKAEIGGSQRSFLRLAVLLSAKGYEIEFAGQPGDWIEDGRFFEFVFHEIPFCPFRWGSIAGTIPIYSRTYQSVGKNSESALLGSLRAALVTIKAILECTVKR